MECHPCPRSIFVPALETQGTLAFLMPTVAWLGHTPASPRGQGPLRRRPVPPGVRLKRQCPQSQPRPAGWAQAERRALPLGCDLGLGASPVRPAPGARASRWLPLKLESAMLQSLGHSTTGPLLLAGLSCSGPQHPVGIEVQSPIRVRQKELGHLFCIR